MLPARFCLLFLLFLSGTIELSAQDVQGKLIEDFLHSYYKTMSDRNWIEYRGYFIDNAILVTIWAPSGKENEILNSTIDEFIEKTPEGPDSQPVFEEKMVSSQIEVQGDLAIAWVNYQAKFGTTEKLMEWEGKDLFTLIQFEDEWRIVSLTYLSE